jgi:hypothetical protein
MTPNPAEGSATPPASTPNPPGTPRQPPSGGTPARGTCAGAHARARIREAEIAGILDSVTMMVDGLGPVIRGVTDPHMAPDPQCSIGPVPAAEVFDSIASLITVIAECVPMPGARDDPGGITHLFTTRRIYDMATGVSELADDLHELATGASR